MTCANRKKYWYRYCYIYPRYIIRYRKYLIMSSYHYFVHLYVILRYGWVIRRCDAHFPSPSLLISLISHPMFCLRTSEPFNSPTLCRGQGSREYRRYQILLSISHPMPCLRTPEPYNSSRHRQRAGDSGISPIANISPDILPSNPWSLQFIKA